MRIRTFAALAFAAVLTLLGTTQASATRPSEIKISPTTVTAGQSLTADIYCLRPSGAGQLATSVNSPGFAAPIHLQNAGDGGTGGIGQALRGSGPATNVPGRYTVSYDCWGWIVSAEFVVAP